MIKKSHIFALLFLSSGIQQSMYGMEEKTNMLIRDIDAMDITTPDGMEQEQYTRLAERIDLVNFFKVNSTLKKLLLDYFSDKTDLSKEKIIEKTAFILYPTDSKENQFFRKNFINFYNPNKSYILKEDLQNDFFSTFVQEGNRIYKINKKTLDRFITDRKTELAAIQDAITLSLSESKVTKENYVPRESNQDKITGYEYPLLEFSNDYLEDEPTEKDEPTQEDEPTEEIVDTKLFLEKYPFFSAFYNNYLDDSSRENREDIMLSVHFNHVYENLPEHVKRQFKRIINVPTDYHPFKVGKTIIE